MSTMPNGPSDDLPDETQSFSYKKEQFVPPHIRAIARAVCSADKASHPKLYALVSNLASAAHDAQQAKQIAEELHCITTEILDGVPLDPQEFVLLLREYVANRELLLPMVSDLERISGTLLGQTLNLTTQLDHLCTECGVLSIQIFPILKKIHCFFMEIVSSEAEYDFLAEVSRNRILHTLMSFLSELLEKGLVALKAYQCHVVSARADANKSLDASKTEANGTATIDSCKSKAATGDKNRRRSKRGSNVVGTVAPEPSTEAILQEIISDALACKPLFDDMPYDLAAALCGVHADLQVHFAHIRWYLDAKSRSSNEDGTTQTDGPSDGGMTKLNDISIQRMWSAVVGIEPACEAELFKEALLPKLVQEWLWDPVIEVVNYQNCGVVSIFSLNKLLKVWGPLVVLEENLGQCVRGGFLCLTKPFEYWRWMFARRPDATAGDYLVALTETPGEVYVLVLNPPPSARGSVQRARDGSRPFSRAPSIANLERGANLPEGAPSDFHLASYPLSQETGLWVIVGMARNMFNAIADACGAFPILFRRACGGGRRGAGSSLGEAGGSSTALPPPSASIDDLTLHHACYHGNARCVRMLLRRGAATIVNCAMVEPAVSPGFCWTPLLCAVNTPNADPVEVVRMLLDAGADPHYADDAECTALYYAIANGYAGSVRFLLERCPTLQASPTTVPLFLALGANWFLPRGSDIRRLADAIPLPSVVAAVLTTVRAYDLVYLAVRVLKRIMLAREEGYESTPTREGGLQGTEASVVHVDEPHSSSDWDSSDAQLVLRHLPIGEGALEIHTENEISSLSRIIQNHDRTCRAHPLQMRMTLRALYDRCFLLSVRNAFGEKKDVGTMPISSEF